MTNSSARVFLIGNGRCGSSLVHEVLARHPHVGFVSNIEDRFRWLPRAPTRWTNELYRPVPPALTRKGRVRFAPSEAYRVLAREVSPVLAESSRDLTADDATPWLAERFRRFFDSRAALQRKPVFLHKFTGWPRSGFIRAVYPEARFVHVLRDGRAVVDSDLRTSWWRGFRGPEHLGCGPLPAAYAAEWEASGQSFAVLAAEAWKTTMDAFAAARAAVPPGQWMDLRYEDVVTEPAATFGRLLGFIGLEPCPVFDRALASVTFDGDRRDAYRRNLDAKTICLLDAALGEHLRTWGYAD